jgi:hypothetical protein
MITIQSRSTRMQRTTVRTRGHTHTLIHAPAPAVVKPVISMHGGVLVLPRFILNLEKLDQLQQTSSPYPYLARPTVSHSSPYPSPFPADSVFALRMQSMTAGPREQPRAHAVLCGEERETVEKGSASTRRVFCGDGCGGCWRAK